MENLHSQVADDLIRRIAMGSLASGSYLPSDTALANEYGIATNTLRRALDHLANLRLIERRRGKGTIVVAVDAARRESPLVSIVDETGKRVFGEITRHNVRVEVPSPEAAERLAQRHPRPVLRFDRHRSHLGRRYMLEDVFLPVRREDLESDQAHLERVAEEIWWRREVAQTKRERLWIEGARETDHELLGVPVGGAVVCIERTVYGARNLPLEYRVARCHLGLDLSYVSY